MKDTRTRISAIRYNPAERTFEASVTLYDRGEAFTYPVSLRAPMTTEYEDISRSITELALRRHARRDSGLHSHHRTASAPLGLDHLPAAVQQATSALWDRLLKRAA